MAPVAVVLVLTAAVFHAAWNLALHTTDDRPATMAIAGLVAGVVLLPAAIMAPPWSVLPLIVISALAETAYALCLSAAYARGALAVAYPIGRGTAPLLVTFGGWLLLGQRPEVTAIVGAVALGSGLALIALVGRRAGQAAAIGFALLTGCAIASYSLVDARAVRSVAPVGYLGAVLSLQGLLLVGWLRADVGRLRRALGGGGRVALGTVAAYLLVLLAFQQAGAGQVATVREVSVLLGVLLARERVGRRVWLGAGLVVGGAILTAL